MTLLPSTSFLPFPLCQPITKELEAKSYFLLRNRQSPRRTRTEEKGKEKETEKHEINTVRLLSRSAGPTGRARDSCLECSFEVRQATSPPPAGQRKRGTKTHAADEDTGKGKKRKGNGANISIRTCGNDSLRRKQGARTAPYLEVELIDEERVTKAELFVGMELSSLDLYIRSGKKSRRRNT